MVLTFVDQYNRYQQSMDQTTNNFEYLRLYIFYGFLLVLAIYKYK